MIYLYIFIPLLAILLAGIRIVRPTQCGLMERLGKYNSLALPGIHWIIPIFDRLYMVNETADKYFIGNEQLLGKLEALETSREKNARIVIPTGTELVYVIGEMKGILRLER